MILSLALALLISVIWFFNDFIHSFSFRFGFTFLKFCLWSLSRGLHWCTLWRTASVCDECTRGAESSLSAGRSQRVARHSARATAAFRIGLFLHFGLRVNPSLDRPPHSARSARPVGGRERRLLRPLCRQSFSARTCRSRHNPRAQARVCRCFLSATTRHVFRVITQ